MKVSVYLKKCSPETSNICFRVREKSVEPISFIEWKVVANPNQINDTIPHT